MRTSSVVLGVAAAGAAYYLSTGLDGFWPAAWVAPIPLLLLAFGSSGRVAALLSVVAYFLGSLGLLAYLARVIPVALVVALLIVRAAVLALPVLAARQAKDRLPASLAAFAFPAAWTALEFLVSRLWAHGTFLSLAYSQTDLLPLLQIASVTGIWGSSFLVTLVPSAIAVAWTRRARSALVPAALLTLAVIGYGSWRLRQPPLPGTVRVGLAATDEGAGVVFATEDRTRALAVARGYAGRIGRLAAAGARVAVLPEKLVGVTPGDSNGVLRVLGDAAREGGVTVVAGLNRIGADPLRNVAVVFAPDGRLVGEYDKRHLLPGPETGYVAGSIPGLFPGPGAQWGVAICKDLDFPVWLRRYGRSGVRILAVPAWDFVRDARLHSRMAVVRGVENGFTVARVATQGLLTFSDGYGRILAEASSAQKPDAVLLTDVAPGPGATFYTRTGDWFAWINVVTILGLVISMRLWRRA